MAMELDGLADSWGVNNGDHLLKVSVQQGIEEDFVAVLQGTQINVFFQIRGVSLEIFINPRHLHFQIGTVRREKAFQAECDPFFFGKRRPFESNGLWRSWLP